MAEMIEMPKLSDTMTEGTLVKWLKKEGDKVESGDVIAEVETDKATMELEVFEEGVLLKTVVAEGDSVPTGEPVAYIGQEGESVEEAPKKKSEPEEKDSGGQKADSDEEEVKSEQESGKPDDAGSEGRESSDSGKEAPAKEPASPSGKQSSDSGQRLKASPLARKIAEEHGINLHRVPGSGPGGRIVKSDVLAAIETGGASAGWGMYPEGLIAEETSAKLSNMRKTIAKRLVQSKQENPHFYVEVETDAVALVTLRGQLNREFAESHGIKFSFNDLVMKAAVMAAREVPQINASFEGDSIRQHGDVHLSFGVALPEGLITPVIREAQNKSLKQITEEANDLIVKAKEGKLKPEEYTGGTLTISNLGGPFGVDRFCAIINPPQAAILAVGNIVKKPVVNERDEIVVGQRMSTTLSADHRVIDGAVAAHFLKALKHYIETPALLLL